MNDINANNLLMQMKILSAKAQGISSPNVESNSDAFGSVLKTAFKNVNETQIQSEDLVTRFEKGDKTISLSDVMISTQKANLSLQAVTQVRNKLVSAYQDIMNMPI